MQHVHIYVHTLCRYTFTHTHTHIHWSDTRTTTNQNVLFLTPSKLSRSTSGWTIPNSVWWTTVQRIKYNPSITPQFFNRSCGFYTRTTTSRCCICTAICPEKSDLACALWPAHPTGGMQPWAQQCLMWHLSQKVLLWHAALSPAMTDVASVPESLWHTELSPAMPDVASIPESLWHTELSPAMPDVASIPESPATGTQNWAQQCLMWHLSQKVLPLAHSTEHLRLWHLHSVEPHNRAHHPQQVPLVACVGELRLSHLRLTSVFWQYPNHGLHLPQQPTNCTY